MKNREVGLLGIALAVAALATPCTKQTRIEDLSRALVRGEQAIRMADRAGLEEAERAVGASVQCLDAPLTPSDVAGIMRLRAVRLFVQKEQPLAVRWMEAARIVDPGYSLPLTLIPSPHPLRRAFENVVFSDEAGDDGGQQVSLPPPVDGWLAVDGRRATRVPANRPFVLQWFDGSGQVAITLMAADIPALWPYPVLRYRRATAVAVEPLAAVAFPSGVGRLRTGLGATLTWPLARTWSGEAGLTSLFTLVPGGAGSELRWLPGARLGLRAWLQPVGQGPFVGAHAALQGNRERAFAVGGLATLGYRSESLAFTEVFVRVGYVGTGLVEAGLAFGIPSRR